MQKHVNLVDIVKSFPTNIYLQNLASIQKSTSPVKFAYLAEKSGKGLSNLSTKATAIATSAASASARTSGRARPRTESKDEMLAFKSLHACLQNMLCLPLKRILSKFRNFR